MSGFADHFSQASVQYAQARPMYPQALFAWIAGIAPSTECVWEPACGSGQATRGLAGVFAHMHASEPSAAQLAQAPAIDHVDYVQEAAEHCSLPDASADAVCVAQALHWFDRDAFFAECARVLKPGGVLVAWGYQDVKVPAEVAAANAGFQSAIRADWPAERADVDAAYAGYAWPFARIDAPVFELAADWDLPRLLAYFGSYSATQRHDQRTGGDVVARYAGEFAAGWGDPAQARRVRWPLFVHACRKEDGCSPA